MHASDVACLSLQCMYTSILVKSRPADLRVSHQEELSSHATPYFSRDFLVADCYVSVDRRLLVNLSSEHNTRVRPKVVMLLRVLARYPRTAISIHAFDEWVWPDTSPSLSTIRQVISDAREALASVGSSASIMTITGSGYRLSPSVAEASFSPERRDA